MTKCLVIAEAGVNHNGSPDLARRLIDVAAEAGADIVKFQTFKAANLVTAGAPKAAYQQRATGVADSQLEMLRRLELDDATHFELANHCEQRGIEFLSTPFDIESLDFLVHAVGIKRIKLPSGEITNGPLLLAAARTGLDIILSTGMSTMTEVEDALKVLAFGLLDPKSVPAEPELAAAFASPEGRRAVSRRITVLHCTSEYPAAFADTNLRAMDTLRETFDVATGLSDHTPGIVVPIAAAARGAAVIEKHFTLDRNLPGPDHGASLEPQELVGMMTGIRIVSSALGTGVKVPVPSELENATVSRKSLVAARPIAMGELFTAENLTTKRPGSGRSPMDYWRLLGTPAWRSFGANEVIA